MTTPEFLGSCFKATGTECSVILVPAMTSLLAVLVGWWQRATRTEVADAEYVMPYSRPTAYREAWPRPLDGRHRDLGDLCSRWHRCVRG